MEKVVRSICQACHCECGVLVQVEDGKVTKIKGDPDNPMNRGFICVKGRAQPQVLYHPDRVRYPMRRVGERGSGKWERISWDTALDEIAEKLTANREKYGPESFAVIHGTGPRPTLYSTALLALALGSPNVISVDLHICFLPGLIAEYWTYGASVMVETGPDYLDSDCIMMFAGNPLASHPPRGVEILEAQRKRNAKLIVVDPYRTELAAKADLWLQIRPGTDVAMAMGMINTIIEEELYDKAFVEKWCHGFEELKARAKDYPLDKVAEITWVPADMIREAARMYATTKPAVLHKRVGVEHNVNSTQTVRAFANLIAITGNLDVQGGNLLPYSLPGYITCGDLLGESRSFRPPPEIENKRIGAKEHPLISGTEAIIPFIPAPLAHEALRDGKPYPIKSLFCGGGNPVMNMQNVKSLWSAIKDNLDLHVVADFFMTPTAELADYVLPPAHWLERDDTCDLIYMNYIAARQQVLEPMDECWHDMKMSIELAKRLPWADRQYLPWDDVDSFNEALVAGAGFTFNELKEKSFMVREDPLRYRRYEENGFKTLTGKVELFCTGFEKQGYDPLPFYWEPPESPESTPELLDEYPYVLYTGGRHIEFFHSEGRQIPALRERVPDPLVEIHPDTAGDLGIEDGEWVWIETPQVKGERVTLKAKVTENVHPKMIHARHGWWFPEKPAPEHGCFESNVNVVTTDDPPREKICASVRTRGTLCKVYKEAV